LKGVSAPPQQASSVFTADQVQKMLDKQKLEILQQMTMPKTIESDSTKILNKIKNLRSTTPDLEATTKNSPGNFLIMTKEEF